MEVFLLGSWRACIAVAGDEECNVRIDSIRGV